MTGAEGRAQAISLLTAMQEQLRAEGQNRLPQRSDFTPEETVQIKAHLGPFPRALEAAGLKAPRDAEAHAEKRLRKRIEAKRRRTQAKIAGQDKTS